MDNTRLITPNGTPYGMVTEKMLKSSNSSPQKSAPRFDPRQGIMNSGPMFTLCSGKGAQILMNSHSIVTATSMQFMPQTRNKTSLCNDYGLSTMPTIKVLKQATFGASTASAVLSAVTKPIEIFSKSRATPDFRIEHNNVFINSSGNSSNTRSSYSLNDTNTKHFCNDSPGLEQLEQETTEGNTLVNTIKSIFSYLMKPIRDTKTMFVGSDNSAESLSSSCKPMTDQQIYWNDSDNLVSMNNKNHKSTTMYCDNHSSDSFSYSSEKLNIMPDTYFDCDDYIDGGEDTIDFIADSTRSCHSFGNEFSADMPVYPSAKDHIYYDCISNKEAVSGTSPLLSSLSSVKLPETVKSETNLEPRIGTADETLDQVQYSEDNAPPNCPKYEKSNSKNAYRRKRKGKRKHKSNVNRRKVGSNKNRHEKIRHEVEMNIHEDIDDCSIVKDGNSYSFERDDDDDDEPNIDMEFIDVVKNSPKIPNINTSTTTSHKSISEPNVICIETPIPSPEVIPSGCIFTRFFRFDNSNCKQKQHSLPLRCMQKQVPNCKPLKAERPVSVRRTSETESDDSFIVFEECSPKSTCSVDSLMPKHTALKDQYKRQRQLSECSDDFILFTDDVDDGTQYHCYTTDEDFTDSTDTDCSDDGKCNDRTHSESILYRS